MTIKKPSELLGRTITDVPSATHLPGSKIIVTPSHMDDMYKVTIDGVAFGLGVGGDGLISYVSTNDPSFITPEGARVGMTLQEMPPSVERRVQRSAGWIFYIRLPSGWRVAFLDDGSLPNGAVLPANARVAEIFMGKWPE